MKSLLSKISRFPIEDYYLYIIASYFLFFIFVRTFIGGALERDEAEQILLTQHFALGYGTQPPLYAWLQSLFFAIFGKSVFALALLKNTLLFLGYYFIFKSSYILTKSQAAASVAVASMVLIPSCSWECQRDLTHTVLAFTLASFTLYWVLRMRELNRNSLFDYLLLGILLALGSLSKYNYILLPVALLIVSAFDAPLRRLIVSYKFALTLLLFAVTLSPHLYWVFTHLSDAVDGTINKIHSGAHKTLLQILLQFLLSIVELFALYFIIFFSIFSNAMQRRSDSFLKNLIFIMLLLLLSILLFLHANRIDGRWFVVLLFPLVILLSAKIDTAFISRIRLYLYISIFFMFTIIAVYLFRFYSPDSFRAPPRFNFPYEKLYKGLNLKSYKNIYAPSSLCRGNLLFISPQLKVSKPAKMLEANSIFIVDKDVIPYIRSYVKRYGIKFAHTSYRYTNSKSSFTIYYFKTNNNR